MAQWFLRKAKFNFHMETTLDQGQEITSTLNTHIHHNLFITRPISMLAIQSVL